MNPSIIAFAAAGIRSEALVWGPEDGVPVLALHGWLDNAASFERLAPLLRGVRVYALDFPGHGSATHRGADAFDHFIDRIPFIAEAAEALELDDPVLMGHSMGGGACMLAAACMPTRGLVLLDSLGPLTTPPKDAVDQVRRSIAARGRHKGREPRTYPSLDKLVELRVAYGDLSADSAERIMRRNVRWVDGGVQQRTDPKLKLPSLLRMTEELVLAFAARITCPTLAVLSAHGRMFPAELRDARIAAIPDAQAVNVEGGHHVHLDDPEPIAAIIQPFLNGLVSNPVQSRQESERTE